MADQQPYKYSVLFDGELTAGTRRTEALANLSKITNIGQEELLEALFSVRPVIVNQNSDDALAREYVEAFNAAGLKVWSEPWQEAHEEIVCCDICFGHFAPLERVETQPNYQVDTREVAAGQPPREPSAASPEQSRYQVIFEGELKTGLGRAEVIANLMQLTKSEQPRVLEEIFTVVPILIFSTGDKQQAIEYQQAFTEAGLIVKLNDQPQPVGDIISSKLRIRQDKPRVVAARPVSSFSYGLALLGILAFVFWLVVHHFYAGIFDDLETPAQVLAVKLEPPAPAIDKPEPVQEEAITDEAPEPLEPVPQELPIAPKPEASPPPEIAPKPTPKVRAPDSKPKPQVKQPVNAVTARQLEKTREDYYLSLLNWFAQPQHQGQSADAKDFKLEGEIKIEITISRDGLLKDARVLSSSSPKLTQVTLDTARRASPYPSVPSLIKGKTYSFTLPLKYTIE